MAGAEGAGVWLGVGVGSARCVAGGAWVVGGATVPVVAEPRPPGWTTTVRGSAVGAMDVGGALAGAAAGDAAGDGRWLGDAGA